MLQLAEVYKAMVLLARQILIALIRAFFFLFFGFKKKHSTHATIEKVINLYKGTGFLELFTEIRLWDAPFEQIEQHVPKKGIIIDLGCGDGLLVNYLALASPAREITGVDLNNNRIKEAYKHIKNTAFVKEDILKMKLPKANAFLLVHVLHHLPSYNAQRILLERCYKKLKRNGVLVIAEIINKPLLKFIFTWFVDVLIVPLIFENKIFEPKIFYRNIKEWKELLQNSGFKIKVQNAHRNKPFSHVLIIAEKI